MLDNGVSARSGVSAHSVLLDADELADCLDDVANRSRACELKLAEHRRASSKCLEAARRSARQSLDLGTRLSLDEGARQSLDRGRASVTGQAPSIAEHSASEPSHAGDLEGDAGVQQARALRNLSKKVHAEAQRVQQHVQQARKAQISIAARRKELLELMARAQQQHGAQQAAALAAHEAAQRSPRFAVSCGGTPTPAAPPSAFDMPTPSPARAQEQQQLAVLLAQKADLTLQLSLRDQTIRFHEQHIELLTAELGHSHVDSGSDGDGDEYQD